MDQLFSQQCKGLAITNRAVACLRRVLTWTVSQVTRFGVEEGESPLNYASLTRRLGSVLPPDLASTSLAYAKARAVHTRPPPLYLSMTKTSNIVLFLVLEYLLKDMLDLSQQAASRHRRILPRHVRIAILCDNDLKALVVGQQTLLFFPDEKVDPLMGRLGTLKFTTHCLSTAVVRKRGECSLDASDNDVRSRLGPFRMYSRVYRNRVVAFLLLSKQENAWRLDYGFHAKCKGVWKRMVRQLLRTTQEIVVPVATSDQVRTFLASAGCWRDDQS